MFWHHHSTPDLTFLFLKSMSPVRGIQFIWIKEPNVFGFIAIVHSLSILHSKSKITVFVLGCVTCFECSASFLCVCFVVSFPCVSSRCCPSLILWQVIECTWYHLLIKGREQKRLRGSCSECKRVREQFWQHWCCMLSYVSVKKWW